MCKIAINLFKDIRILKYLLVSELRANCFFLVTFLRIQAVPKMKVITIRTTIPGIKPIIKAEDVRELGSENDCQENNSCY